MQQIKHVVCPLCEEFGEMVQVLCNLVYRQDGENGPLFPDHYEGICPICDNKISCHDVPKPEPHDPTRVKTGEQTETVWHSAVG